MGGSGLLLLPFLLVLAVSFFFFCYLQPKEISNMHNWFISFFYRSISLYSFLLGSLMVVATLNDMLGGVRGSNQLVWCGSGRA
jgi:hypothetical protein